MNKTALAFCCILAASLLFSCGAPPPQYIPPADSGGMSETENVPDTAVPPDTDVTKAEIFIPSGPGNPPQGILEQVSWFGGGGGLTARECGECMAYVDNGTLKIVNFAPNQNLTLVFYRLITGYDQCGFAVAEYVTTVNVQVDEHGSLSMPVTGTFEKVQVNTVIDSDTLRVEIPGSRGRRPECSVSTTVSSCPGAPPQRVQVGKSASICTQADRLIVRGQPSTSGEEIIRLDTGTSLNVIDGPICSDGMSWWKIKVKGTVGWVSEGGDNVDPYFICPAP